MRVGARTPAGDDGNAVSSQLHKRGRVEPGNLNGDGRRYNALQAYRDSKLATIMFTQELQRRLDAVGSPVRAITAHPGIARTSLNDHVGGVNGWLSGRFTTLFNDADHGAYPLLYAATADIPGDSYVGPDGLGHFRGYPEVHQPGRVARGTAELARELWAASAQLTGTDFPAPVGQPYKLITAKKEIWHEARHSLHELHASWRRGGPARGGR